MPNNILITPGSASIQFSGSTDNIIRLQVQPLGQVDFISQSVSILSISNRGIDTTGSITSTGGITGSLLGTASFAQTASFFTGSVSFPSGLIVTGSILATTVSASSFIGTLTGTSSFATSASFSISSSRSITASFATSASFAPLTLPSGVVSSSLQINTGSFSGSFTGTLIGTSSWASNAVSSSYAFTSSQAISASAATSITFIPSSASFATTASFAVSASWAPGGVGGGVTSITAGDGLTGGLITSTGTITLDTGSVHFLDGVKKELNTEGVVSSSQQINTGSFTGSFTGLLFGTSSWANNLVVYDTVGVLAAIDGQEITPASIITDTINVTNGGVTGSFTGSLRGQLIGTASWASSSISSSFSTTASFAQSASFAPTKNGIVSSSLQFNTLTTPFTGSFTGSFSGSLDRFNPVALRITVGTTAPSSPAVNDLWVDTN